MDVNLLWELTCAQITDRLQKAEFSRKKSFLMNLFNPKMKKETVLSFKFYWNLWCWAVDRSREDSQSMS
jgi:hypothetical protein